MLSRQKAVLSLLSHAGKPLSRLSFVKLVFLLRQEAPEMGDSAFYDFVPYRFGPFSFALYREMEALASKGYVTWDDDGVALAEDGKRAVRREGGPPEALVSAVESICRRYAHWPEKKLVADVYRRYPWYTSRSELTERVGGDPGKAAEAPLAAYTIGYAGRSVDAFFDGLLRKGIKTIVDVRANPVSRKYGFARRSLSSIAERLGLQYTHEPEVGVPSGLRKGVDDSPSLERLLDFYEREILPKKHEAMLRVSRLIQLRPSVMLCAERDAGHCHRGRLAKAVAEHTGLPVVHL